MDWLRGNCFQILGKLFRWLWVSLIWWLGMERWDSLKPGPENNHHRNARDIDCQHYDKKKKGLVLVGYRLPSQKPWSWTDWNQTNCNTELWSLLLALPISTALDKLETVGLDWTNRIFKFPGLLSRKMPHFLFFKRPLVSFYEQVLTTYFDTSNGGTSWICVSQSLEPFVVGAHEIRIVKAKYSLAYYSIWYYSALMLRRHMSIISIQRSAYITAEMQVTTLRCPRYRGRTRGLWGRGRRSPYRLPNGAHHP